MANEMQAKISTNKLFLNKIIFKNQSYIAKDEKVEVLITNTIATNY
jgi:hypothetical protein